MAILVLNQSSISSVFPKARFAGDQKTALTGNPCIWTLQDFQWLHLMFPTFFGISVNPTLESKINLNWPLV